jgi:hypothetical protein
MLQLISSVCKHDRHSIAMGREVRRLLLSDMVWIWRWFRRQTEIRNSTLQRRVLPVAAKAAALP